MNLNLILDVAVTLALEVGRVRMPVRDLLQLAPGAIVELDRLAGEPLDVLVNGVRIARGEVVVVQREIRHPPDRSGERDRAHGAGSVTGFAATASPLSVGSVAQLTLSLTAIVALIFAVSWIVKRLKLGTPRSRGEIAVIDELALGPRERIVLVRVGDAQVLVGVGRAGWSA